MDINNCLTLTFLTQLVEDVERKEMLGLSEEPEFIKEKLIIDVTDIKYFRFAPDETILGLYTPSDLTNVKTEIVVEETEEEIMAQLAVISQCHDNSLTGLTNG